MFSIFKVFIISIHKRIVKGRNDYTLRIHQNQIEKTKFKPVFSFFFSNEFNWKIKYKVNNCGDRLMFNIKKYDTHLLKHITFVQKNAKAG